mgnify:CR=1 FL=1
MSSRASPQGRRGVFLFKLIMNFKAVIFDMDGTLIDSDSHWIRAEKNFLKRYNIEYSDALNRKVNGNSVQESSRILKEDYNIPRSLEEIINHKIESTEEVYAIHSQPIHGAEDLLKRIKNFMKIAIASGASLDRIKKIVERFNWHDYFDELVSVDHVNYIGKPDPRIFLFAAEKLGILPEDCVVIEDSENGLRAAKGAGMSCVVLHEEGRNIRDFSSADLIINSFSDPRIESYLGLKF